MNSVNLIGRLVFDPEKIIKDDGLVICNFRLAIDDVYSKEDRADFANVTIFGQQAELCMRYLRKGFLTGVTGHLHSDIYIGESGEKKYPLKVIADRIQFLQWPERVPAGGPTEDLAPEDDE